MYISTIEEFLNSIYIFPDDEKNKDKLQKQKIFLHNKINPTRPNKCTSDGNELGRSKSSRSQETMNSPAFHRFKTLFKSGHLIFKSVFNLQSKTNKLRLSFIEYVGYLLNAIFCKKKTKKQKLIQQAEKTFSYDLDIVNLIKKVHDLEKLKLILLNEEQLILFDHLSRPMIPFEKIETKIFGTKLNSNSEKTIREVYQKMKTSGQKNEIDAKLSKLFEQNPHC